MKLLTAVLVLLFAFPSKPSQAQSLSQIEVRISSPSSLLKGALASGGLSSLHLRHVINAGASSLMDAVLRDVVS